jgi:hypothetical protein
MGRWEYWTSTVDRARGREWDEMLNEYGAHGWELVSVVADAWSPEHGVVERYRVVMKRPMDGPPDPEGTPRSG